MVSSNGPGTMDSLTCLGQSRHKSCAQQVNSGFEHFLMAPTPKIHNIFSATNAPRDPAGRRDPEFSSIRTSVSVFMHTLSKGCTVRKIQRMACLFEAFGVLVGKKIQLNGRPNGSCSLRGPDFCRCAQEGRHIYAPRTHSPTHGWSV